MVQVFCDEKLCRKVRVYRCFAGTSAFETSVSSNAVTQNYVLKPSKLVSRGVNYLKVPGSYLMKHYTGNDVLGSGGTVVDFVKFWH
jgi:hypothetical protein